MQSSAHDKAGTLLHLKEVATELGVHVTTVRRAVASGELEAVRLGPHGRYRVRREAIDAFLRPVDRASED